MIALEDRFIIYELISLHGHLVDDGRLDELDQVFAVDATFDLTAFDLGMHRGLDTIREAALALGDKNPVGHHVTNIVMTSVDDRVVHARSKGLGVNLDGTTGSAVYIDIIKKQNSEWRIISRKISVRHKPLSNE